METKRYDVWISCYGTPDEATIHHIELDGATGRLTKRKAFSGIENPSFITLNEKEDRLYAISEVAAGEVASYIVDKDASMLTPINRQYTKGGPCFVEVEQNSHFVLTANYGGGSVIVHRLQADGTIGEATDYHVYETGEVAHLHMIQATPIKEHYIATDLGNDALYIYQLNQQTGKLTTVREVHVPEGSGPRHVAFHPTLPILYIVNEFDSKMLVYAYDSVDESITLLQSTSTLLTSFSGDNYGADIHVTASGKYVFTSNRGHHSLTTFEIKDDGTVVPLGNTSVEGEWPRNFAIAPDDQHVLVANEHTNEVVLFKLTEDGTLEATGEKLAINRPVCIQFSKR